MILAIDTGSPIVGVALASGRTLLASTSETTRYSSRELLRMINHVVEEAGIGTENLKALMALRGPGSFTGLRIGLSTMYGLHQALGIPARAISTLEVLTAVGRSAGASSGIAVVDALRGEWFVQAFFKETRTITAPPVQCLSMKAILNLAPKFIIGHGVKSKFKTLMPKTTQYVEPESLAVASLTVWPDSHNEWDPQTLTEPLYFREAATTQQKP